MSCGAIHVRLRTILRHNAPTGEPLSPGNGGSAPAHEPVSEPELVPPLTRLSGLTCGIAPWGAESGTYCSDTLRDTQKPDYLISFFSPSGSEHQQPAPFGPSWPPSPSTPQPPEAGPLAVSSCPGWYGWTPFDRDCGHRYQNVPGAAPGDGRPARGRWLALSVMCVSLLMVPG